MTLRIFRGSKTKNVIQLPVKVQRSKEPYHVEQGWQRTSISFLSPNVKLKGYYRTRYGSFRGEIKLGSSPSFYIINPPDELRGHSHWQCFSPRGGGRYSIHFAVRPRDVDSGIMRIERMIHEAFALAK